MLILANGSSDGRAVAVLRTSNTHHTPGDDVLANSDNVLA